MSIDPDGSMVMPSTDSANPADINGATSYREAMRATVLTGASSVLVILFGMVRSKVIAVCVGPSGIGLFGILSSTIGLAVTMAGMGVSKSGVRQVAAASASDDRVRMASVICTLRRTSLAIGFIGTVIVALLAEPIARVTTGSTEYSRYLLILAPMVFLAIVNGGQTALLRGFRQIANLARLRVFGALIGTLVAVPFVLRWGLEGIAPAILVTAGAALMASWWYARRVRMPSVSLNSKQLRAEIRGLFGLGLAFLFTGLLASVLRVALRAILLRQSDLYTVGQFVAAAALSNVYADFVLQAMGLDYLPRLTRSKDDNRECNRLVNEQTEISLLVGGPGVIGFVLLAPVLIPLLYSNRFVEAVKVFQWQSLGVLIQLASWPVGTVFLAKGLRKHYVTTLTFKNLFYLLCFYLLAKSFGLIGAAVSFAIAFGFYLPMAYFLVRRITGFEWSSGSRCVLFVTGAVYAVGLASKAWLPQPWGVILGSSITVVYAIWAYRELCQRLKMPLLRAMFERAQVLVRSAAGLRGH